MIRILMIAYNYPPLNNGGVPRSVKFEKFLTRFNVKPIVLTQSLEDPVLNIENGVIRVRDIARTGPRGELKLTVRTYRKMSRLLGWYFSSYDLWRNRVERSSEKIIGQSRPDVILASFPPAAAVELGLLLADKAKIPLVADFRDGLLFEPVGPGSKLNHIRARHRELERKIVARSAMIVTASDAISDYFRANYNLDNVHTVTNGFDPEDFESLPQITDLDHGKFNIVYTGRLSLSDAECDASTFFKSLIDLASSNENLRKKIRLYMIGQFTRREISQMKSLIESGVVIIKRMVHKKAALAYQKASDLLLLMTSTSRSSVITSKLFEYLYTEKPILALAHGTAAAEIISQTGSGWVISPNDGPAISELLTRIITDKNYHHSLVRNQGRIEQYSCARQINRLSDLIHDIIRDQRQ